MTLPLILQMTSTLENWQNAYSWQNLKVQKLLCPYVGPQTPGL